jgi:hypothetical protein
MEITVALEPSQAGLIAAAAVVVHLRQETQMESLLAVMELLCGELKSAAAVVVGRVVLVEPVAVALDSMAFPQLAVRDLKEQMASAAVVVVAKRAVLVGS